MPVRYSEQSAGPMTRREEENPFLSDMIEYTSARIEYPASSQASGVFNSPGVMTKAELQALAVERGLSTSGTKADLIERLTG
jgi:hypothetical protein